MYVMFLNMLEVIYVYDIALDLIINRCDVMFRYKPSTHFSASQIIRFCGQGDAFPLNVQFPHDKKNT